MKTETTLEQAALDAQVILAPHLEKALEYGINPRAITGSMLQLAAKLEIDIEAVGMVTEELTDQPADEFCDDLFEVVWFLCENPETLVSLKGDAKAINDASEIWRLKHLTSIAAEAAAMRAFVARWTEHRLQMAIVFGNSDSEETEKEAPHNLGAPRA